MVVSTPSNSDCSSRFIPPGIAQSTSSYRVAAGPGNASSCAMPWHLCMLRASVPVSAYVRPSSGSKVDRSIATLFTLGGGSLPKPKPVMKYSFLGRHGRRPCAICSG